MMVGLPEYAEREARGEKLLERAFADFAAAVDEDDAVGVFNSGEAMGDENLGHFALQRTDRLFDSVFRDCV